MSGEEFSTYPQARSPPPPDPSLGARKLQESGLTDRVLLHGGAARHPPSRLRRRQLPRQAPNRPALAGFSRGIDYGLLAASLFVLATFKCTGAALRIFGMDLSQHPFTTGGRQLLSPSVLREDVFAWPALTASVLCAAAVLVKCGYEIAGRRLNVTKTLHVPGRRPVLHHLGAAEPERDVAGPEHLALVPVPGGGDLPQPPASGPRHHRLRHRRPLRVPRVGRPVNERNFATRSERHGPH